MTFKIINRDRIVIDTVYAPNYDVALRRAIHLYGLEIEVEEK